MMSKQWTVEEILDGMLCIFVDSLSISFWGAFFNL